MYIQLHTTYNTHKNNTKNTPSPFHHRVAYGLEVTKNGTIIEEHRIADKAYYTFGRTPNNGAFCVCMGVCMLYVVCVLYTVCV